MPVKFDNLLFEETPYAMAQDSEQGEAHQTRQSEHAKRQEAEAAGVRHEIVRRQEQQRSAREHRPRRPLPLRDRAADAQGHANVHLQTGQVLVHGHLDVVRTARIGGLDFVYDLVAQRVEVVQVDGRALGVRTPRQVAVVDLGEVLERQRVREVPAERAVRAGVAPYARA